MKSIISLVLVFSLLFPPVLFAQEAEPTEPPKVIELNKGDPSPFSGVLLNTSAAAQMLANKKYLSEECNLRIGFEVDKLIAQHELMMKSLQASLDATESKHKSIMDIKNSEIERLSEIALEKPNDYSHWWAAGGFLAGTIIALGIFLPQQKLPNRNKKHGGDYEWQLETTLIINCSQ